MRTILYLHGLGSGGNSPTSRLIQKCFPEYTVVAPQIPINPTEALEYIRKLANELQPYFIMGTSLGAFYTAQISGFPKFLVNPVLTPSVVIPDKVGMGVHNFLAPRTDAGTYTIDDTFISALTCQQNWLLDTTYIDNQIQLETFAIFGEQDCIVNDQAIYTRYYGDTPEHILQVPMPHRIDPDVLTFDIVPYIKKSMELLEKINWEFI